MSKIEILDTDMITHSINLKYNQDKYKCFQMIDKDITRDFKEKHTFIKIPVSINADNKLTVNPDKSIEIIDSISISISQNDSIYKAYKQEKPKIKSHQKGVGINQWDNTCYYNAGLQCISNILPFSYNIIQYSDYYNQYFSQEIGKDDSNIYFKKIIEIIQKFFRIDNDSDSDSDSIDLPNEFRNDSCPIQHKGVQEGSNALYSNFVELLTQYNIDNTYKTNDIFKKLQIPFIKLLEEQTCLNEIDYSNSDVTIISKEKYNNNIKFSILEKLIFSYSKNTKIREGVVDQSQCYFQNIFNLILSTYFDSKGVIENIDISDLLNFYIDKEEYRDSIPIDTTILKIILEEGILDSVIEYNDLDFLLDIIKSYINHNFGYLNKSDGELSADKDSQLLNYFKNYKVLLNKCNEFKKNVENINIIIKIDKVESNQIQINNNLTRTTINSLIDSSIESLYQSIDIDIENLYQSIDIYDSISSSNTPSYDLQIYEFKIKQLICEQLMSKLYTNINILLTTKLNDFNFDKTRKYTKIYGNPYIIFDKDQQYIPRIIVIEINWSIFNIYAGRLQHLNHTLQNYNKIKIKNTEYILFAVSCKSLYIDGGHYVAHKRRFQIYENEILSPDDNNTIIDTNKCWDLINDGNIYTNETNYKYSETIKNSTDAGSDLYPTLLFYEKIEKNSDGTILNHKLDHGVYYRWAGDYETTGPVI